MAENVIALMRAIVDARGKEYADGPADMANILAPTIARETETQEQEK